MLSVVVAVSATLTLVLTGTMAGLFYAFSVSVMPGLDAIKADQAIAAMQSINRKIQTPLFLLAFVLSPVTALVTGGLLLAGDQTSAAILFFLAAAAYVLGTFVPTVVVNVPMNEALDRAEVPADTDKAARLWSDYSGRWTRWNTLRAVSNLISLLLVGLAIFVWDR